MVEPLDEEKLRKKIILGPAVLRQMLPDQEHFGLYRPLVVRGWDENIGAVAELEMGKELGPLMVYRRAAPDEQDMFDRAPPGHFPPDMFVRTTDPRTNGPVLLFKVFDARTPGDDVEREMLREAGDR